MKLKKRIVGFLLLAGIILIIIPLFFGRSIPSDELKLSGHIPGAPPKPKDISVPIPPRQTTVPEITQAPVSSTTSLADSDTSAAAFNPIEAPVAIDMPSTAEDKIKSADVKSSSTPAIPVATVQPSLPPAASAPSPSHHPAAHNKAAAPMEVPVLSTVPTATQPVVSALPVTAPTPDESLPPPPKTAPLQLTAKSLPAAENNVTKPQQLEKPSKPFSTALKSTSKKPVHSLPSGAEAWAVQLGSFAEKHNAEKLIKKLQAQGFAAYINSIKTAKGTNITKVMVGPSLHRSEAEQVKVRIQKELNLQGIVVKTKS